jgi:hypothetical protein
LPFIVKFGWGWIVKLRLGDDFGETERKQDESNLRNLDV